MSERAKYKGFAILSILLCASVWYFSFGIFLFEFAGFDTLPARAASLTWDGEGVDNDWCTDANWSGDAEPTSIDTVTINTTTIITTDGCLSEGNTLSFSSLTIGDSVSSTLWLEQDFGTAADITVAASGTLTQATSSIPTISGTLTVESGGNVNHADNGATQEYTLNISVGNLDLQSGGTINVDDRGYNGTGEAANPAVGGNGPGRGLGSPSRGGGGAHGGNGGNGIDENGVIYGVGGEGYGEYDAPIHLGSSGGSAIFAGGGDGGGAVKITITGGGTATIAGDISAKGGEDEYVCCNRFGGAGAGGSIWVDFSSNGTLAGAGSMNVDGGRGTGASGSDLWVGGSGGGGRIAITGHNTDTFSGAYSYNGGWHVHQDNFAVSAGDPLTGGGGTLFVQEASADGDLKVGRVLGEDDETLTIVSSTDSLDSISLLTGAKLNLAAASSITLASSTIGTVDATSTVYFDLDGAMGLPSTFTLSNNIDADINPNDISGVTNLTIDSGGILELKQNTTSTPWTGLDTLNINGLMRHAANSSTVFHAIYIEATTVTIGSGATITASGLGYAGATSTNNGNGPGAGTFDTNDGGGGAYGGDGGDGANAGSIGGSAYGSTSTPASNFGSSGAGSTHTSGGAGGGVIHLVVTDTITVNGDIVADGAVGGNSCGGIPASGAGGGAGGGIHLEADTIAGAGLISAAGGDGGGNGLSCGGGGGGGGRILLTADTNTFSGTTTSTSGSKGGSSAASEDGTNGSNKISPSKPTTLFSAATDASSGSVNPTQLASATPVFSAIYNGTENATGARIQVSTSSVFATTLWDAGESGGSITSCSDSARCSDITYSGIGTAATTNLSLGDDASEATDTTYYWRIKYIDTDDVSSPWSASSTFTLQEIPDDASSVAVSSITATTLTVAWTDNSSIEDNYLVSYSTDAGVTYSNTSTEAANTTSTNITGLTPNTSHVFSVVANNTAGDSTRATTTTLTLANKPTALVNTATTKTTLTFTWTANSNPSGTEYCIVLSTESCSASDWQTGQNKTFSGLDSGVTYTYKVKARNSDDVETDFTAAVSATTQNAGGGGPTGGGGPAPSPPAPLPIDPEAPPEEDPLQPTGLIQIIQSDSKDLLNVAGVSKDYTVSGYNDVLSINPEEPAISFDEPFALEIEFTLNASPLWRVPQSNALITKNDGSYVIGYKNSSAGIQIKGFCFEYHPDTTFTFHEICDKQLPVPFVKQHYVVRWDGETIKLFNGNETVLYDSRELKVPITHFDSVYPEERDLNIGGSTIEYAPGKFAKNFFPVTFHTLQLKKESSVSYVNNKNVKLKIDATYSNLLWLDETDNDPSEDFTAAVLDDIEAEKEWQLSGEDGKKCINAKFLNQPSPGEGGVTYEYVTYACVFLDTTKPSSDFDINSGIEDGKVKTPPRIFGVSEPNAKVTIKLNKKASAAGFSPFENGILKTLPSKSVVGFLSGINSGTYTTTANSTGSWEYTFSSFFDTGDYDVSVVTKDLAKNMSDETTKTMSITESKPSEEVPECEGDDCGEEVPECEGDDCGEEVPECEGDDCGEEVPECEGDDCGEEVPECEGDDCGEEVPECEGDDCGEEIPECEGDDCGEEAPEENPPVDIPEDGNEPENSNDANTDGEENANGTDASNGNGSENSNESGGTDTEQKVGVVKVLTDVLDFAKNATQTTINTVKQVIDNPQVEEVNEKVAVPAAIAVGVANVAAGAQIPNVFVFLKYLFGQPLLLIRRRKKKTWGVIYNAYTKRPVDLATVRVVDEVSGKVVRTQVTDTNGRYFLFVGKGRYKIEVIKPGFKQSDFLKGKTEDAKYSDLYHGDPFAVTIDQKSITFNIPVDPEVGDKPAKTIVREHLKKVVQHAISLSGLIASIASYIISPSMLIGALVMVHLLFYIVFHKFAHEKRGDKWGVVTSLKGGEKLSRVVVRVFEAEFNKLVNTGVTDRKGRYASLVGPGTYFVTYEKPGFEQKKSENHDFSEGKTDGIGGIIIEDAMLRKQTGRAKDVNKKKQVVDEKKVDENFMETGITIGEGSKEKEGDAKKAHEDLIQRMKDKAAGVED